ncbi:16S rRNA (uracil(1498)-N(3))-methyltransferase [Xinfangfangia sp. CPCC 101601]|uniref:Ribosomal RNA small subunit methyltransferase E n=1 Tax=Pseudogemmobacter lacusdianii TaxID=3069608 RepID=A0ABU0W0E3_9RHOB|nr:16S rRNA (uracil(1498)-N(3))-methyltransferase [Xinfangfangia sp. CPCC 101601]MDQ2067424.1 16S rRNA (uracil(1498)-N(3))-methyltransferase [Xinfangfangia sp. CPCC 101601]
MTEPKVRLHIDQPLAEGQAVALDEGQANYLFAVMRLQVGAALLLFNGRDGEWRAEVAEAAKRRGILICRTQTKPQQMPPDLWLLFSPLRKERTAFLVEKAVELGVARLLPVSTRYLAGDRFRLEKERAHAVEAAEQCGATFVPQVEELQSLDRVLKSWDPARRLFWADEALAGQAAAWPEAVPGPAAILIGPEGGFSPEEKERLRALPYVAPLSLGPRILRAETAALAALTLWQSHYGDWR